MTGPVLVEIIGLKNSECSPFPCDADRTCGLFECHPSGSLTNAYAALKNALEAAYGKNVEVKLTLIDNGVPDHIRTILETELPPIPMVLVNNKLTRIGRISLDRIKKEIDACS